MKLYYTTDFKGHNPVGQSAVIVARDRGHALRLLKQELFEDGLLADGMNKELSKEIFKILNPEKAEAVLLQNGQY